MSPSDPDTLVDRRRLKRQISLWRGLAILACLGIVAAGIGRWGWLLGEEHLARLGVSGIIVDDPARSRALAALARDRNAKALLVHIDSPGGTVVGGESLFREIRAVAANKPVVAVMGEVATSGGYMAALAADHLVAREGTITGSIGVFMQTADITGLLAKLGITAEAIKSAPLKAVPSPLEELTVEGRAALKSVIDDSFAMFVDMVAERRGVARQRALELADGRVYTGRQAKTAGLLDAIGGEREAREWLASKGVGRELPMRELKIEREDQWWRDLVSSALRVLSGKTYLSERLALDGLVTVWHPDWRVR
ncbi:MAG: signal peptide peptidase SppA [Pseudomonadota bacterium]